MAVRPRQGRDLLVGAAFQLPHHEHLPVPFGQSSDAPLHDFAEMPPAIHLVGASP